MWHVLKRTPSYTNIYSVIFLCFPGTKGRNKGEFTNLQGVAASSLGKVLIADSNNQCVQVTNHGGALRERSFISSVFSYLEHRCLCTFSSPFWTLQNVFLCGFCFCAADFLQWRSVQKPLRCPGQDSGSAAAADGRGCPPQRWHHHCGLWQQMGQHLLRWRQVQGESDFWFLLHTWAVWGIK